jgi:hypothetical protein
MPIYYHAENQVNGNKSASKECPFLNCTVRFQYTAGLPYNRHFKWNSYQAKQIYAPWNGINLGSDKRVKHSAEKQTKGCRSLY